MFRVLVIAASLSETDVIKRHVTSLPPDVELRYPSRIRDETENAEDLLRDCCEVIREEDISGIIGLNSGSHLVAAALLCEFPELKAASFDSVFLCLNLLYQSHIITQTLGLRTTSMDIDDLTENPSCVEDFGCPCVLRDQYDLDETFYQEVASAADLNNDVTWCHGGYRIQPLLESYLNRTRYPLAFDSTVCVACESYPPHEFSQQGVSIHSIEACVADHALVPWAISDLIYGSDEKSRYILSSSLPSSLADAQQYQIWAIFREIAQRLISRGYNNQFLHAKVMVLPDAVKVFDIKPSFNRQNTVLYKHVLQNGDNFRAQINLSLGRVVPRPKTLPLRHAMTSRIVALKPTAVSDVINFYAAEQEEKIDPCVHSADEYIEKIPRDGFTVAYVHLTATTKAECEAQLEQLKTRVMEEPYS